MEQEVKFLKSNYARAILATLDHYDLFKLIINFKCQ